MTVYREVKSALETEIQSNWTATKIFFENVSVIEPGKDDYYVVFHINWGGSENITIGRDNQRQRRAVGIARILLNCPRNIGTGQAYDYTSTLAGLFTNKTIGRSRFYSPEITEIGFVNDYYQLLVRCPFRFDLTHLEN